MAGATSTAGLLQTVGRMPARQLIVLMVGVALGEPRYFVDLLAGLLRVLLGVGLRLLLQVVELAHAILLCLSRSALPPGRVLLRAYPYAGH